MKTVGIIAEYNPFHNGHAYLIEEAKKKTGADYCVVVMSGNFVQRGVPAMFDKYLRTEMALKNGADAVFELPAVYATSSAELFAEAGVKLLYTLGCVDYIAFGSESGDIDLLMKAAEILEEEPPKYKEALSGYLKEGNSFAAARCKALVDYVSDSSACTLPSGLSADACNELLSGSNNILALEYCKAILRLKKSSTLPLKLPKPVTIKRLGQAFNDADRSEALFPSASGIRKDISADFSSGRCIRDVRKYTSDLQTFVPESVQKLITGALGVSAPVTEDDLSNMLFIRLAMMCEDDYARFCDIPQNLLNSIKKLTNTPCSFTEAVEKLKTKNYAYSTISRSLLHIILNFDEGFVGSLKNNNLLPYARLLGFKMNSSVLLRSVSDNEYCTLITKLADASRTEPLLAADIRAAECYNQLVCSKFGGKILSEFEHSVIRM